MPLGLKKFWRRVTTQKTAVKPFVSEAESEPASPRHHSKTSSEVDEFALHRPASTNEEVRPLYSPQGTAENSDADASNVHVAECSADPPSAEVATPSVVADEHVSESTAPPSDAEAVPERESEEEQQANELAKAELCCSFDEVLCKVGKEFGEMTATSVRSTKWDKRVQALKAMSAVLKGLDLGSGTAQPSAMKGLRLRDRSSCWRTICQVLHHALRDKVMPVRLASHDLFCETFSCPGGVIPRVEIRAMAGTLLGIIIEMLGDSNLRLHESARKCVFFCAQRDEVVGFKQVLTLLHDRLNAVGKTRERMKVSFGVLDTVSFMLKHFLAGPVDLANCSWTLEDITPFVVAGMDDALGPRVRSSAVAIAVMLRTNFGGAALEPLVVSFRPAVQSLLREKFAELEDESGSEGGDHENQEGFVAPSQDIMASLMICGSAIKVQRPSTSDTSVPGSIDEDTLMDEILEETGAVFSQGPAASASKGGKHPSALRPAGSTSCLSAYDEAMIMAIDQELDCPTTAPKRQRCVRFNLAVETAVEVF